MQTLSCIWSIGSKKGGKCGTVDCESLTKHICRAEGTHVRQRQFKPE